VKALLTGASGFVGRNLLLNWISQKRYDEIILPVRNPQKLKQQLSEEGLKDFSRLTILESSAPRWDNLHKIKLNHLVHSAGLLFGGSEKEFFETNVEGTLNLVAQTEFESAIILSSQAASGPCKEGQLEKTELDMDEPITWYGKSKLEMENRLQANFASKNYLCIRPPMILGARDTATLPLFKMVKSRLLFKPGLQPKHYSFISVQDLVLAINEALQRSKGVENVSKRVFFVASPETITDELLITTAAQAAQKPGVLIRVPQQILKGVSQMIDAVPAWRKAVPSLAGDRALEIWPDRWVVSSKRFQDSFAWSPQEGLLKSLQEAYQWYVKNGDL